MVALVVTDVARSSAADAAYDSTLPIWRTNDGVPVAAEAMTFPTCFTAEDEPVVETESGFVVDFTTSGVPEPE